MADALLKLPYVLYFGSVRYGVRCCLARAVELKPQMLGVLEQVHEAVLLEQDLVEAVLVLLLEVDEVPPALAEVADQLMLFILYFVKDGIVVYAVHDLLIDSHLLRLDGFEFLPLSELLLSSKEALEVFDKEFECLDQAFGLLFVEPLGDEVVREEQTRVLVLR